MDPINEPFLRRTRRKTPVLPCGTTSRSALRWRFMQIASRSFVRAVVLCGFSFADMGAAEPPKTVNIRGSAADICGLPFANGTVRLTAAGRNDTKASTKTDEDGKFTFVGVLSKPYDLHFEAPGFEPLVEKFTNTNTAEIDMGVLVKRIGLVSCPTSTPPVPYHRSPLPNTLTVPANSGHAAELQGLSRSPEVSAK